MGEQMENGPQTIPEYAEEIAGWLDSYAELCTPDEKALLRYFSEHIRQDIPGLQRDEERRKAQHAQEVNEARDWRELNNARAQA